MRAVRVALVLLVLASVPLAAPPAEAAERQKVTTELSFPDASTARVDVTIRYDTDTTRVESYRLPPGFEATRVEDDSGRLDFDADGDPAGGQVVEFEPSYAPGSGFEEVEIVATRRTDEQDAARRTLSVVGDGSFFFVAYGVAYEDWRSELVVRAPSRGRAWVSTADLGIETVDPGRSWSRSRDDIVQATVFVVADEKKADLVAGRVGNYTVLEPRAWAADRTHDKLAEAIAQADASWPRLVELRGRVPQRDGGFLVVFARDDLFAFEEGFYQAGVVAVRRSSVENGTVLEAASTLVHETMHGFVDDVPWLLDEGRWLNEAGARWAEYLFEAAHADDLVVCEDRVCRNLTRRLTVDELERYESDEDLPAWRGLAGPRTSDEYGEAAYVVEAWVAREGERAYRELLEDLRTYPLPSTCAFECVLSEGLVEGHMDGDPTPFFHPHAGSVGTPAFAEATVRFAVAERTTFLPPESVEAPPVEETPPAVENATPPEAAPDVPERDAPPPVTVVGGAPVPTAGALVVVALAALLRRRG